MRAVAAAAVLGSLLSSTSHARADGAPGVPAADAAGKADRCATAYDRTQRFRQASQLRDAQREALICADPACPAVLHDDCTRWVDELQRATPTIVLHVTGKDGCDLVAARVTIDGASGGDRRQGVPLAIDPGVRKIRVEAPGLAPIERDVVVAIGERDRRVDLAFAPAGTTCGARRGPAVDARAPSRPTPPIAYVLGGFGLASLAGGAAVGIAGFAKRSDLGACKLRCSPDDVDAMRRTFIVSDVLVGLGVASIAAAVYLYVTRPTAPPSWTTGDAGSFRF